MIDLREKFTKKNVLLVILAAAVLLILQVLMMKEVRTVSSEVRLLKFDKKNLDASLSRRMGLILRYKSALRFDYGALPKSFESPREVYSAIIDTMSSAKLAGSGVIKTGETHDSISFSVKGEGSYFSLMEALASFRKSGYMLRLTGFTADGRSGGDVIFSFAVQAGFKVRDIGPEGAVR